VRAVVILRLRAIRLVHSPRACRYRKMQFPARRIAKVGAPSPREVGPPLCGLTLSPDGGERRRASDGCGMVAIHAQGWLPAGWLAFAGRASNPLDHYERFQITWSSPSPVLLTLPVCVLHSAGLRCQAGPSSARVTSEICRVFSDSRWSIFRGRGSHLNGSLLLTHYMPNRPSVSCRLRIPGMVISRSTMVIMNSR
jgi:hypothetical protein